MDWPSPEVTAAWASAWPWAMTYLIWSWLRFYNRKLRDKEVKYQWVKGGWECLGWGDGISKVSAGVCELCSQETVHGAVERVDFEESEKHGNWFVIMSINSFQVGWRSQKNINNNISLRVTRFNTSVDCREEIKIVNCRTIKPFWIEGLDRWEETWKSKWGKERVDKVITSGEISFSERKILTTKDINDSNAHWSFNISTWKFFLKEGLHGSWIIDSTLGKESVNNTTPPVLIELIVWCVNPKLLHASCSSCFLPFSITGKDYGVYCTSSVTRDSMIFQLINRELVKKSLESTSLEGSRLLAWTESQGVAFSSLNLVGKEGGTEE